MKKSKARACEHFTICCFIIVVNVPPPPSPLLLSPTKGVYCIDDILQLAVEGEEAQGEGGQHGEVVVVIIAAALALAAAAAIATAVAAVAAVAVVAAVGVATAAGEAGIGVAVVGVAADDLVALRLPSAPDVAGIVLWFVLV